MQITGADAKLISQREQERHVTLSASQQKHFSYNVLDDLSVENDVCFVAILVSDMGILSKSARMI